MQQPKIYKRPSETAVGWGSGLGSAFKTATAPTLKLTATQKLKELLNAECYTLKPTFILITIFEIVQHFTFAKILRTHKAFKRATKLKLPMNLATLTFTAKEI